ncbi:MAG: hypothetical protein LJE84_01790 [Gammaproteobacteria bacterium]|nr:hypothetical protein [Gammaproteobacteria bacterium]
MRTSLRTLWAVCILGLSQGAALASQPAGLLSAGAGFSLFGNGLGAPVDLNPEAADSPLLDPLRLGGGTVRLGPRWQLLGESTTHVYYLRGQQRGRDPGVGDLLVETEVQGAGVAQSLELPGARRGELRFEYGFEDHVGPDSRLAVHRFDLSGTLALTPRLKALVGADFGLLRVPDGAGQREGARFGFRAGVSHSLGDWAEAGINYRFAEDAFDSGELSRREQVFGLNLRMRY